MRQQFFEYPYTSHYFKTPYGRLHYLDEGDGNVVVCVHGNPTWSYFYRNLVKALAKTHRVIAFDHLGCGLSDKPQNYQYLLENHIDNLRNLLDYLGIFRFSLVMHDWGGAVGMGVATENPGQIERFVILNTAAFRSSQMPLRIALCRIPLVGEIIIREYNGFAWPATFMAVEKRMKPEIAHGYLAPYDSWENRIAIQRFVADIPMKSSHPSYQRLVRIEKGLQQFCGQKKTLLLWGGKDFCFNDSFYKRWLELFPDASHHYFPDAGHYLLEDVKEETVSRICSFFAEDDT